MQHHQSAQRSRVETTYTGDDSALLAEPLSGRLGGRLREQRLRPADRAQSPVYQGVWQRPADGKETPRKDGAEVAGCED